MTAVVAYFVSCAVVGPPVIGYLWWLSCGAETSVDRVCAAIDRSIDNTLRGDR